MKSNSERKGKSHLVGADGTVYPSREGSVKAPFPEKLTDKQLDEIINLFCVVDYRPYPEGTGIWGADTEIFSEDEDKSAIQKAREAIREIIEKNCFVRGKK